MSAETELPAIWDTAKASVRARIDPDGARFGRRQEPELVSELARLQADDSLAVELAALLYAGATSNDQTFYDPLVSFANHLTFTTNSHKITGIVWAKALAGRTGLEKEQVLLALTSLGGGGFGRLIECLPDLFRGFDLPPQGFLRWAEAMAVHIGSKYGGAGLEIAIADYAQRRPDETLEMLNAATATETNFGVLSVLAGRLRIKHRNVPATPDPSNLLARFKTSSSISERKIFYQSWFQEAVAGALASEYLDECFGVAALRPVEDRDFLFCLLCSLLGVSSISSGVYQKGLEWLESAATPTLSDVARSRAIHLAAFTDRSRFNGEPWRPEFSTLILAVQPINPDHAGIWSNLDIYLGGLLAANAAEFQKVFLQLAERENRNWLAFLEGKEGMPMLLEQMRATPQVKLVGGLCFSPVSGKRRMGLYFFEELGMENFPATLLSACDERYLWLLLNEVIAKTIEMAGAARCLLQLLSQAARCGDEFCVALKDELLLQVKNYGGACGELYERQAGQFPVLREVLDERDRYFEALAKTRTSVIRKMGVPGRKRAEEEHQQIFQNEISRNIARNSIFGSIIPTVHLLYGRSWSTFQSGQLSAPTNMSPISHSMELPRMELIDPEDMQFRALHARSEIRAIEQDLAQSP